MYIGLLGYNTSGKQETDAYDCANSLLDQRKRVIDMLVLPEYTNISDMQTIELSAKAPKCLIVSGSSLVKVDMKIFNRTYVAYGGKIIGQYDKMNRCGRENHTDSEHMPGERMWYETFEPGTKPLRINLGKIDSKFPNVTMGVENCLDNIEVKQKTYALDLLVLISAGALGIKKDSIKHSGSYVHVDGCNIPHENVTPTTAAYHRGKTVKALPNSMPITIGNETHPFNIYHLPYK